MATKTLEAHANAAANAIREIEDGRGGQQRAGILRVFLSAALQEITALEVRIEDGKPLPTRTLRAGMRIQKVLDLLGLDCPVRQITPPGTDEGDDGTYRITWEAFGTITGTVEQLERTLGFLAEAMGRGDGRTE